ncbi:hypothetical protein HPB51_011116 [Rhipicephalus microplus]|uniref:Uncharacterized protein n=1 Tax=Rhipicephalus microplus TaxID=6941 RepID=A0A9J6E0Q0_RHIMP|nr:hypothetical protein HPB51_011116 [Rhipicephalus microplus]
MAYRSEKQEAVIPGPPRQPPLFSLAPVLLPFRTPGPHSGACPGRSSQDSPRTAANGWIPGNPFLSTDPTFSLSGAIPLTHAHPTRLLLPGSAALSLSPVTSATRRPGREPRAKNTKGGPRLQEHAPSPSSAAWGLAQCLASRREYRNARRKGEIEKKGGRAPPDRGLSRIAPESNGAAACARDRCGEEAGRAASLGLASRFRGKERILAWSLSSRRPFVRA